MRQLLDTLYYLSSSILVLGFKRTLRFDGCIVSTIASHMVLVKVIEHLDIVHVQNSRTDHT